MTLSIKDLQVADVLLSTGSGSKSWAIRTATFSRYSHAALYVGNGNIIESVNHGVIAQALSSAIKNDAIVSVYRRVSMSKAQANMVVRYANQQIGKPYDVVGAFGVSITSKGGGIIGVFLGPIIRTSGAAADLYNQFNPEGAFYCSELVAMAFTHANAPLCKNAPSATPHKISRSHVLNYLGDLKVK